MLNELKARVTAWWWQLWTGYGSLEETRRALEEEVRRFDGKITWGAARRPARKKRGDSKR